MYSPEYYDSDDPDWIGYESDEWVYYEEEYYSESPEQNDSCPESPEFTESTFLPPAEETDFVVKVGDQSFNLSRSVLSSSSGYFRALFSSGMKEVEEGVLHMNEVEAIGFHQCARYMYTSKPNLDSENILPTLSVAHMMQMDKLTTICLSSLQAHITIENCVSALIACDLYGDSQDWLTEKYHIRRFISDRFDLVLSDLLASRIQELDFAGILGDVADQKSAWNGLVKWISNDPEQNCDLFILVREIDLKSFSLDYFLENVMQQPFIETKVGNKNLVAEKYFSNPPSYLTIENFYDFLANFDSFYLPDPTTVRSGVADFLERNLPLLYEKDGFLTIDREIILTFIRERRTVYHFEDVTYEAALRWIKHEDSRKSDFMSLFAHVTLKELSPDRIQDIARIFYDFITNFDSFKEPDRKTVLDEIVNLLERNLPDLYENASFLTLDREIILKVLGQATKRCTVDRKVRHEAALRWIKHEDSRKSDFISLFAHVWLQEFSPDRIRDIARIFYDFISNFDSLKEPDYKTVLVKIVNFVGMNLPDLYENARFLTLDREVILKVFGKETIWYTAHKCWYEAALRWIKHEDIRKSDFMSLFANITLKEFSPDRIQDIARIFYDFMSNFDSVKVPERNAVLDEIVSFLGCNLADLYENAAFLTLDRKITLKVLGQATKRYTAYTRKVRCEAALRWIKHEDSRKSDFMSLFANATLKQFSPDHIQDITEIFYGFMANFNSVKEPDRKAVLDEIANFLEMNLPDLYKNDGFLILDPEIIFKVFEKVTKLDAPRKVWYEAALRWIKHEDIRKRDFISLFKNIALEQFSPDRIRDIEKIFYDFMINFDSFKEPDRKTVLDEIVNFLERNLPDLYENASFLTLGREIILKVLGQATKRYTADRKVRYEAALRWIKHEDSRKNDFMSLFANVTFQQFSQDHIHDIVRIFYDFMSNFDSVKEPNRKAVLDEILNFLKRNLPYIYKNDGFLILDREIIFKVLGKVTRWYTTQKEWYEAALRWIKHEDSRRGYFISLFGNIALEQFSPHIIRDITEIFYNFLSSLVSLDMPDLEAARIGIADFTERNLSYLYENAGFLALDHEIILAVFESTKTKYFSEKIKFDAALRWVGHEGSRKCYFKSLFEAVGFKLFSSDITGDVKDLFYEFVSKLNSFDLSGNETVRSGIADILDMNLSQLYERDEYLTLNWEIIFAVFRRRETKYFPEKLRYLAALRWVKHDESRKGHLQNLFWTIDFKLLSPAFIRDYIQTDELVMQIPECRAILSDRKAPDISLRPGIAHVSDGRRFEALNLRRKKWVFLERIYSTCSGIVNLNGDVFFLNCTELVRFNRDKTSTTFPSCPKYGGEVLSYNDRIYVIGDEWILFFDVFENCWLENSAGCGFDEGFCAAASNDYIYVVGMLNSESKASKFEPDSQLWSEIPSPKRKRHSAAAVVYKNLLFVMGGKESTISVEYYDPKTMIWGDIPNMLYPRYGLSSCVVCDKLYAVGGTMTRPESVEVYDERTKVWRLVKNMANGFRGGRHYCCPYSMANLTYKDMGVDTLFLFVSEDTVLMKI